MKLINLYSILFALANNIAILFITSSIPILFKLIAPVAFTELKNLIVRIFCLAIDSYITTDNIFTI